MIKITWKHRFAAIGMGLLSAIIISIAFDAPTWSAIMMAVIVQELTLIKIRLGMMEEQKP